MIETLDLGESITLDRIPLQTHSCYRMSVEGQQDRVHVHAVVGARRHPCLALLAGVHGDEYDGILALMQLLREVSSWPLEGSLIIVPVANPFAFAKAQRRTPEDDKDLNRVFPGSQQGTVSDRLAARLCTDVIRDADLIFTLHGSTSDGILAPWVEFLEGSGPLEQRTREAAEASGFTDLISLPRLKGVLISAAAGLEIPAIEGEVGGRGTTTPENVQFYMDRVRSVCSHTGILQASRQAKESKGVFRIWRLQDHEAEVHGIFLRSVELGQRIHKGEPMGTILDISGAVSAEVRSPVDAVIGGYRIHAGVQVGDRLVTLWCAT